jgi:hypothetical protein
LIAAAIAMLGGCGNSTSTGGAASEVQPGRNGEILHWSVRDVDSSRTFIAQAAVDYCVGWPEPKIGNPNIEYRDDDVLVTLSVIRPDSERENQKCAGVERNLSRAITVDRALDQVTLFDAGSQPPEKRWPE